MSKRIFDNLWSFVPICVLYLTLIPVNFHKLSKNLFAQVAGNNSQFSTVVILRQDTILSTRHNGGRMTRPGRDWSS